MGREHEFQQQNIFGFNQLNNIGSFSHHKPESVEDFQ